jgi:hypothetical protein
MFHRWQILYHDNIGTEYALSAMATFPPSVFLVHVVRKTRFYHKFDQTKFRSHASYYSTNKIIVRHTPFRSHCTFFEAEPVMSRRNTAHVHIPEDDDEAPANHLRDLVSHWRKYAMA